MFNYRNAVSTFESRCLSRMTIKGTIHKKCQHRCNIGNGPRMILEEWSSHINEFYLYSGMIAHSHGCWLRLVRMSARQLRTPSSSNSVSQTRTVSKIRRHEKGTLPRLRLIGFWSTKSHNDQLVQQSWVGISPDCVVLHVIDQNPMTIEPY